MDSRNSWIDRRELSELLRQLLPDALPGEASAPQADAGTEPEADDPVSLLADDAPIWEEPSTAPLHRSEADLRREALRSLSSILPFTSGSFSPGDTALPQFQPESASLPPSPPRPSFPAPAQNPIPASNPAPAPGYPSPPGEFGFQMPPGPLSVRLRAFTSWVGRVTGCTRMFITDSQGYSLLDSDASGDATAVGSALQLLEALDKFRHRMHQAAARSGLYLPVGPNEWFGVVECDTSAGPLCLCLLIPAPLSASAALELARVLRMTVET